MSAARMRPVELLALRAAALFVLLAILLVGADPTPSFLGIGHDSGEAVPSEGATRLGGTFVLPTSVTTGSASSSPTPGADLGMSVPEYPQRVESVAAVLAPPASCPRAIAGAARVSLPLRC